MMRFTFPMLKKSYMTSYYAVYHSLSQVFTQTQYTDIYDTYDGRLRF